MSIGAVVIVVCLLLLAGWFVQTYGPEPFRVPLLLAVVLVALGFIASVAFPGLLGTHVR